MTLNKNKKLNGVTKIARLSYFAPDRKRLGSISLTKGRMPKSIAHYKHDEQLGELSYFYIIRPAEVQESGVIKSIQL